MRRSPTAQRTPRRILVVVAMKGIGDAVESLPAFELIKRHLPDAELHAGYFKDKQESLLRSSPHVAGLVRLHGNAKDPTKSLPNIVRNTRALRRFEVALFLYKRDRIAWTWPLAAALARTRLLYRHGYRYRDPRRDALSDFPQHVLFQLVASNLLLGKPLAAAQPPRIIPGPVELAHAARVFAENGLGDRPVAIFNLRAPKYAHIGRWGTDRFARVAEALHARGVDVMFNGGLQEQADELEGLPPHVRREITVIGGHTPLELAAVIHRCDVFIGEPSGPTFLALAVGTPTVTLQGPGDHAYPGQNRGGAVWWPHRREHRVISKVEWCQLTMGASCTCTHMTAAPAPERAMKYVGVWEAYKGLRRSVRPRALRPPAAVRRFPCLVAIEPADVVAAATDLLADRLRPPAAAPDNPVATR